MTIQHLTHNITHKLSYLERFLALSKTCSRRWIHLIIFYWSCCQFLLLVLMQLQSLHQQNITKTPKKKIGKTKYCCKATICKTLSFKTNDCCQKKLGSKDWWWLLFKNLGWEWSLKWMAVEPRFIFLVLLIFFAKLVCVLSWHFSKFGVNELFFFGWFWLRLDMDTLFKL